MIATFLNKNSKDKLVTLDVDYVPSKGMNVTLPTGRNKVRKTFRVMDVCIDYQVVAETPCQVVLATAVVYVE